ncbi:MAG: adenylosuccinate synthetase [Myxococcales bacterium]|nr:adenylosuccinate synthetase [Myxococcales bacterium]MCB9576231.1 adenylosuccinate synthetase [Polyangiaceae bacterium]
MSLEAWIVVDLGFGDAGKGTITDFLVRERGAEWVVRFNGGAQAGHNVVTDDGRHHTFSQLGAGSFVPGVRSYLGPDFVLHPGALLEEARALARVGIPDAFERLYVDDGALLVSPFQGAATRLRELGRGDGRHGTTGVGIGEAVMDARAGRGLRAADIHRPRVLADALRAQLQHVRTELAFTRALGDPRAAEEWRLLDDSDAVERTVLLWREVAARLRVLPRDAARRLWSDARSVVFEGAQGVLLDQDAGFHPHTTWGDCTTRGARALLQGTGASVTSVGVTRAYATRHGEGPLPTEDEVERPEPHNESDGWQGAFRSGPLDLVLLRTALRDAGGVDALALTHLDAVPEEVPLCDRYRGGLTALDASFRTRLAREGVVPELEMVPRDELIPQLEARVRLPVVISGHGPAASHKRWSRGSAADQQKLPIG